MEHLTCKACCKPFSCTKTHRVRRGHTCQGCHLASLKEWKARNPEKVKQRIREWRADPANRQKTRDKAMRRYYRLVNWLDIQKSAPCMDCGVSYPPYVMDFDHVRGTKTASVSELLSRDATKRRALAEIAKCELVCSNCHRKRTFNRRERNKNVGGYPVQFTRVATTGI
jgi:hypothetical protein